MHALLLLALLALPARALALGNVQAVVRNGVLEVTGDEEANVFRIAASGPGTAVVSVFEGTTVNDGLTAVTLSGVSSLRIDTGAGDDDLAAVVALGLDVRVDDAPEERQALGVETGFAGLWGGHGRSSGPPS